MKLKLTNITPTERNDFLSGNLKEKIERSKQVITQVMRENTDHGKLAIAWTGGKDSTLLLWLIKMVCEENKWNIPQCIFIDEGDVFDEIIIFRDKLVEKWNLELAIAHNSDVSKLGKKIGSEILVSDLNDRNKKELGRLGYDKKTFPYLPESFVGNHLMKTVATNLWLESTNVSHLFVGVRWDEQGARGEDDYLRKIDEPEHFRVEPILHITERDVWDAIKQFEIPYVSLYENGYRSLGAKSTTGKVTDTPAWNQDIENTTERAGRQQDKEKIMARLRALGYM